MQNKLPILLTVSTLHSVYASYLRILKVGVFRKVATSIHLVIMIGFTCIKNCGASINIYELFVLSLLSMFHVIF